VEAAKGEYFAAVQALHAEGEVTSTHHAPTRQRILRIAAKRILEISDLLREIKNQRLQLYDDDRTRAYLQGALANLKSDILFHRKSEQKTLATTVERHCEIDALLAGLMNNIGACFGAQEQGGAARDFYWGSLQLRQVSRAHST
jgi:hypothetical protein